MATKRLTLHIYSNGLDGRDPNPILCFTIIATPLQPLDLLNPKGLIKHRRLLEFVRGAASSFGPSHLEEGNEKDKEKGKKESTAIEWTQTPTEA